MLISRLLDGRAAPTDWQSLATIAASDTSIWAELARARELDVALIAEVHRAVAVADHVALPGESPRLLRFSPSWKAGWAVAALLALAFVGQFFGPQLTGQRREPPAITGAQAGLFNTAEDAIKAYMERGQQAGTVVAEMPQRYVLESRPLPEGGYEVLYLRQFIERSQVKDVYRLGADETGRSILVPAQPPSSGGAPL